MKKLFYLLLCIVLICSGLPGCSSENDDNPEDTSPADSNDIKTEYTGIAGGRIIKEIVSGLECSEIYNFSEGLAVVFLDRTYGYIDKTGELAIPCVYDFAHAFNGGLARVKRDGREIYIDKTGREVITVDFDEVGDFSEGLAWIRRGDKYGYIDETGDVVIPIVYDCYYDEEDIEHKYAMMFNFSDGLVAVNIDGKCGFIDKTGELVIPAIYYGGFFRGEWVAYMPAFKDGFARVIEYSVRDDNGKTNWGIINKAGETVIPFGKYSSIGSGHTGFYNDGLIKVSVIDENNRTKSGFIDTEGNIVVPLIYDYCSDFNGSLAYVHLYEPENKGAYIDKTGALVTPFDYYADQWSNWFYTPASDGMTFAQKEGKIGCLDSSGNIAVPFEYYDMSPFSDGLAFVMYGEIVSDAENIIPGSGYYGKNFVPFYGVVDKIGNIIVPLNYTGVADKFANGLAWVQENHKYGYIDNTGELVVPCIYDYAGDFYENLAVVKKDGKWAILGIK